MTASPPPTSHGLIDLSSLPNWAAASSVGVAVLALAVASASLLISLLSYRLSLRKDRKSETSFSVYHVTNYHEVEGDFYKEAYEIEVRNASDTPMSISQVVLETLWGDDSGSLIALRTDPSNVAFKDHAPESENLPIPSKVDGHGVSRGWVMFLLNRSSFPKRAFECDGYSYLMRIAS